MAVRSNNREVSNEKNGKLPIERIVKQVAPLSSEELEKLIRNNEVETIIVGAVDNVGKIFGKRIPGDFFLAEGINNIACTAANITWDVESDLDLDPYEFSGWHTGFHDIILKPDLNTLRLYPWCEKTAFVMSDIYTEEGELVEIASRTILKRQIEKAASMGYKAYMGSELEFFVFKETPDSVREKGYTNLKPLSHIIGDYSIYRNTADEWFLGEVRRNLKLAGIPVESQKGEWGFGQAEIGLIYADALEMADRHVIYKLALKEMAVQKGLMVTFMAKYDDNDSGNGCHVHCSLWDLDSKVNAFKDEQAEHRISETGKYFLGGQQHLFNDFFVFTAPYTNSYKRYVYKSFAPTNNTWGYDNRCINFRLVGHGNSRRIEYRAPGADINPYLLFAAMMASGLYGIENKIEPVHGPIINENGYEADAPLQPQNLAEALKYYEESKLAPELLGKEAYEHFLVYVKNELLVNNKLVTNVEKKRLFELI